MSTRVTRGRGRGRATASSGGRPEASSAHEITENGTANRVMDVDESGAEADSATTTPTTTLARGSSISRSGAGTSRGVGGLLAESSEYARKSTPGPSTATSSKLKFVPNMRRKVKPKVEDDDECVFASGCCVLATAADTLNRLLAMSRWSVHRVVVSLTSH